MTDLRTDFMPAGQPCGSDCDVKNSWKTWFNSECCEQGYFCFVQRMSLSVAAQSREVAVVLLRLTDLPLAIPRSMKQSATQACSQVWRFWLVNVFLCGQAFRCNYIFKYSKTFSQHKKYREGGHKKIGGQLPIASPCQRAWRQ